MLPVDLLRPYKEVSNVLRYLDSLLQQPGQGLFANKYLRAEAFAGYVDIGMDTYELEIGCLSLKYPA